MNKLPKQEKRLFYNNDDSAKSYIFAILLPYIFSFIVGLIISAIVKGDSDKINSISTSPIYLILASFIAPLSFLLVFILYTKAFNISFKATNIHKKLSWQDLLITLLVTIVAFFGLYMFMECHDTFLSEVLKYNPVYYSLPNSNAGWLILQIFLMALLPAVCEELMFRGLILQGLRKNLNDKVAIILSALMFTLMHARLEQIIYPFLLGLVFGWIVVRTGSLLASMIIHFLNNTLALIFKYLFDNFGFNAFNFNGTWWYVVIAFVVLAVAGVIIYLIDRFYFKGKNKDEIEKEYVYKPSAFLWLGLGVGALLLILNTVSVYLG